MDDLVRNADETVLATEDMNALDQAACRVKEAAHRFAHLGIDQRIALARQMLHGMVEVSEAMVRAGCGAKGLAYSSPASAEEWATGPLCIIRHLRLIIEQLQSIAQTGNTRIGPLKQAYDGRTIVQVFPENTFDRLLYKDCLAEVRMQHGEDARAVHQRRAQFYRSEARAGQTVLVLGAGNIAAIGPMDVITKMFNEGKTCLLKMNPVNAYLGRYIERAFAEAIRQGFLAVIYGGAEEGRYLTHHAAIDEIHLTGSDATHDMIVWGAPGPDRDLRKRLGKPLCTKHVTSELGNVSPVILVPGPYTEHQLAYQAEELLSAATMNAGFLCNAARVVITSSTWPDRRKFLMHLQRLLAGLPTRKSYYPGASETWRQHTQHRKDVLKIGHYAEGSLPWTFISGLDPSVRHEPFFEREAFCPILTETNFATSDSEEFLERAVEFANTRLWGTLSATLVVHPSTMKDPRSRQAVERAIARLRYGTVAINAFPGMSFAFGSPPWGAYPGASLDNIQSGRGWVHNTMMLEGIEKAILRFPLTRFPKPPYFPSHRNGQRTLQALLQLEANPGWSRLPGVMWNALRG